MTTPNKLYNKTAEKWQRTQPKSFTDFVVRPKIFELCKPVDGKKILDLGCGEGYAARYFASHGAGEIFAVDISEKMLELANANKSNNLNNISYHHGSIIDFEFENSYFDMAVGIFVYNYLKMDEMQRSFKNVYKALKSGGRFIFSLPHPLLPFLNKHQLPTYFDCGESNYFSGVDKLFSGKTWCVDGEVLDVQLYHKTLEGILEMVNKSEFSVVSKLSEVGVTKELIIHNPNFFSPVKNLPLYIIVELQK